MSQLITVANSLLKFSILVSPQLDLPEWFSISNCKITAITCLLSYKEAYIGAIEIAIFKKKIERKRALYTFLILFVLMLF